MPSRWFADAFLRAMQGAGDSFNSGYDAAQAKAERNKRYKEGAPLRQAQLESYQNTNDKFLMDHSDLIPGEGDIAKSGRLANQSALKVLDQAGTSIPGLDPSAYKSRVNPKTAHMGDSEYTGPVGRQPSLGDSIPGLSFGSIGDSGGGLDAAGLQAKLQSGGANLAQAAAPAVPEAMMRRAQESKMEQARAAISAGAPHSGQVIASSPTMVGMPSESINQNITSAIGNESKARSDERVKEDSRKQFGSAAANIYQTKQINTGEDLGYKVQQGLMTPEKAAQAAKAAGVSVIPPKHSATASNEIEKTARAIQLEIWKLERAAATSLGADQAKIAAQVAALKQQLQSLGTLWQQTGPVSQAGQQPQATISETDAAQLKTLVETLKANPQDPKAMAAAEAFYRSLKPGATHEDAFNFLSHAVTQE